MNVFDYEYLDEEELESLEKQINSETNKISKISTKKLEKEAYILLYEEIESLYNKHYYKAFEMLNNIDTKNNIINNIIEKNSYNKEIEIYLKSQYYKINKNFFNEYKNYTIPEDTITEKKSLDWGFFFSTILMILFFPIFVICGAAMKSDKKRKK